MPTRAIVSRRGARTAQGRGCRDNALYRGIDEQLFEPDLTARTSGRFRDLARAVSVGDDGVQTRYRDPRADRRSSNTVAAQPTGGRKVRQLDNDVQSIYEMLATIEATQRRQSNRLEEIARSQAEQDAKRIIGLLDR